LTTALDVLAGGRSVVVLEARDRVGGRVRNLDVGGGVITEGGAEFIGPTQNRIAARAQEFGIQTYKTYNDGNNLYYRNGQRTPYASDGPLGAVPPDPSGLADALGALTKLNQMATEVPLDRPYDAPNAQAWDSQTFETWKQANTTTDSGRFLLDLAITSVFSCEPRDVSLLFVVFYIAGAGDENTPGDINKLVSTPGGAQESRIVGGTQLIPIAMAKKLGKRVVLKAPVRRIVQERSSVRVEADGVTALGQRVVIAAPPPMVQRMRFSPQLPPLRAQLLQRLPMGSVMKVHAVYDAPFWRNQGFTGQVTSDTGPVQATFDNTPPAGSPGILMGFVEASIARRLDSATDDEIRTEVLDNFALYFGPDAKNAVTKFMVTRWDPEEFTGGCPVCFTPPGVLLDYGAEIRKPVGRIHWAGTETSTYWNGYMDGAVRSGERVAKEILPLIKRGKTPRCS
jgi:monoamine oxidase